MADRLFEPGDLAFATEYPELDKVKEFESLSESDYRFVWSMGNVTSPYFHIKPQIKKINACIKYSYSGKSALSKSQIIQFEKENYEDYLKIAIDKMKTFSPNKRTEGKEMVNKIFESFRWIIENGQEMMMNPETQQKYIDNAIKIKDALPDLIQKAEDGFGYKQRAAKKSEREATELDDAMSSEDLMDEEW